MRRALMAGGIAALVAAPLVLVASQAGSSVATTAQGQGTPSNPTTRIAGLQHFCGTNGITCAEPATTWEELRGYDAAVKAGAHIYGYIGHDEPSVEFYSNQPGSGNNVTYQLKLPKDPPTRPAQDGSGGTFGFQLHPTFWLGMVMCDPNGSPNPDGASLDGHATPACRPDSNSNIFASENPSSSRYFGLGPGQAYEEMQFYPPGWAPWPTGIGCTAKRWCAALNIDTFSDNENTGALNNTACLNSVVPYTFSWPGSISNPVADRLLHPTSQLFSSPTTRGSNFTSMAFESDISRDESADTAFRVAVPCQRHFLNPMDTHPGLGCVNPPPNSVFYPFFSIRNAGAGCMWQEGGPYIPGTTNDFGGSAAAEFGSLTVIHYPTAPFGTITERSNDFRSSIMPMVCPSA